MAATTCVSPTDQRVAAIDEEPRARAYRQADLRPDVPHRKSGEDRCGGHRANALDRRPQRITPVEGRLVECGERTQQDRLLRVQHAGLVKLKQVALDPVGMLVDVLDEQD